MLIRSITVLVVTSFLFSSAGISFAAQSERDMKSAATLARIKLSVQESRDKFKPVSNEEFEYKLLRPLSNISLGEFNSDKRVCYNPNVIVEVQKGKIIYVSKGPAVKVTCPKLPFEK
ncbi:MAG: hypothetical protein WC774_00065 [Candidatus Gracilibacteria bacterium]|jgi:hypothetical protein